VIRLALQIFSATLTTAWLLWTGPSADITELGSQGEKQSILLLVEVKHNLIRCHLRASYYSVGIIGRFPTRIRLSLLVRLKMGRSFGINSADSGQVFCPGVVLLTDSWRTSHRERTRSSTQRRELAFRFLRRDEIGIGVLSIQKLLVAAGCGGFIKMSLGAGGSQKAERVIRRLGGPSTR
jgi:hypothetical protein